MSSVFGAGIYQYSDVLSALSVCLLQGDNLGESRAGRFSLLLHLNELLYLMRRSRKKQLCVVTSPEWSSMMSIAAVSSSSTLCSSSSDIKEDLVGEAMFLLLCVWGMFGGPENLGEAPRTLPQKKAPKFPVTFGGLGAFFWGNLWWQPVWSLISA